MKQNSGKHARFMLEKRQRVPATAADDEDEEVSTIPVATTSVRGGRQPLPTVDPDDEETATAATTTRGRVPLTTSESSASLSLGRGGGRTTAETTTSTAAAPSLVFTPSSTSSSTSSTTPRTTSRTSTSSTSARPTTSSASLSSTTTSSAPTSATSGITNNADTANQTNKDEGGSNTGAIAGAVIGVLVLLAIAAFFGLRYRKKKQRQAEDAAIFSHGGNNPGGAAGLGASAFGKRQSAGYNQHVDSNEDLPSGGNNGNGYGYGEKDFANVGEKQHSSGMAGYGTLALNSAANGGNNNNFNGFSSPSHAALLGRDATGNFSPVQPGAFVAPAFPPGHHDSQDRFSNFSNGYPHSVTAGDGVAEYPPPVAGIQQNPHASMQSFASNPNRRSMGPSAAMMAHPQDSFNAGSSQLPPHQDHALASALNRSSGSAYPAGAIVAAAAAQNVPLPLSPATATRQSINSVATAAAAAALGNQPTEDSVDGPFGDPSHEGKIYIVTRVFEPSMPDELVFYPGDRIQVVVTYDDGWCLGCNLDSPQRDGKPPARGVFPRDCVEELTPETEAAFASRPASQATVMGNQTPVNFDEDRPMASGGANLQRAPTLPPLDMGNSSRFSMGSAAAARQSEEQARQSKRFSTAPNAGKRQSRAIAESDADDEMDDAYGGVAAATSATPTRTAFPPEIQVSSSASPPTGMDARRASHQFGSTQHIADYASQLEQQQQQQQQQAARRLSTLDEESNSHMTDEFPSTPRTAHPDSPQVSHLVGGNRSSIAASPAGSAARLSIAGLPKSSSASSIKRTSSLIASKDADLFLAFGDLGKDGRQQ